MEHLLNLTFVFFFVLSLLLLDCLGSEEASFWVNNTITDLLLVFLLFLLLLMLFFDDLLLNLDFLELLVIQSCLVQVLRVHL